MGKNFDELSKALARGESRRTTLKRFATGAVGAFLASTPFRGARAQDGDASMADCNEVCREMGLQGREFGECVRTCVESGTCYFFQECRIACGEGEGVDKARCLKVCLGCITHGEFHNLNGLDVCWDQGVESQCLQACGDSDSACFDQCFTYQHALLSNVGSFTPAQLGCSGGI